MPRHEQFNLFGNSGFNGRGANFPSVSNITLAGNSPISSQPMLFQSTRSRLADFTLNHTNSLPQSNPIGLNQSNTHPSVQSKSNTALVRSPHYSKSDFNFASRPDPQLSLTAPTAKRNDMTLGYKLKIDLTKYQPMTISISPLESEFFKSSYTSRMQTAQDDIRSRLFGYDVPRPIKYNAPKELPLKITMESDKGSFDVYATFAAVERFLGQGGDPHENIRKLLDAYVARINSPKSERTVFKAPPTIEPKDTKIKQADQQAKKNPVEKLPEVPQTGKVYHHTFKTHKQMGKLKSLNEKGNVKAGLFLSVDVEENTTASVVGTDIAVAAKMTGRVKAQVLDAVLQGTAGRFQVEVNLAKANVNLGVGVSTAIVGANSMDRDFNARLGDVAITVNTAQLCYKGQCVQPTCHVEVVALDLQNTSKHFEIDCGLNLHEDSSEESSVINRQTLR